MSPFVSAALTESWPLGSLFLLVAAQTNQSKASSFLFVWSVPPRPFSHQDTNRLALLTFHSRFLINNHHSHFDNQALNNNMKCILIFCAAVALLVGSAEATTFIPWGIGSLAKTSIVVRQRDAIVFTNTDNIPHTVTFAATFSRLDLRLDPAGTQTLNLDYIPTGVYPFKCKWTPSMTGALTGEFRLRLIDAVALS